MCTEQSVDSVPAVRRRNLVSRYDYMQRELAKAGGLDAERAEKLCSFAHRMRVGLTTIRKSRLLAGRANSSDAPELGCKSVCLRRKPETRRRVEAQRRLAARRVCNP